MDGATAWQRFRNVTLPGLRPVSSAPSILLGIIWTFNQFAVIFLLFGNTAPDAHILVTWAYQLASPAAARLRAVGRLRHPPAGHPDRLHLLLPPLAEPQRPAARDLRQELP